MKHFSNLRSQVTTLLLLTGFAASHSVMLYAGHLGNHGAVFSSAWIMASLTVLGLVNGFPKIGKFGTALLILGTAILIRLPYLFWFAEGDDIYRYIWEGMIQTRGFSPFIHPPDSEALIHLRDALWEGINNKSVPAVYPPLAQLLFRMLYSIHPSPFLFKSVFTLCDLMTTAILLKWSDEKGFEPRYVLLFSLSPVSIIFGAGEGHLDAAMVTALTCGLYLYDTDRFGGAFFLLSCAIMIKIIPLILIPFLLTRGNIRYLWLAILPFGAFFLYQGDFFRVLVHFAGSTWYNGPLSWIARKIHMGAAPYICALVFILWSAREFFFGADRIRSVHVVMGLFFLCTMVFHPWYLTWAVMLLPFYRSATLITLAASVCFTFTVNDVRRRTGVWNVPDLPLLMEYIPVIVVYFYTLFMGQTTGRNTCPGPTATAVIVPVLNEKRNLALCLKAILQQTRVPDEIWVVDGGSVDGTIQIAGSFKKVKVLSAQPGRGTQIAAAVTAARADLILICHADVIMPKTLLDKAFKVMKRNPSAVGGAFLMKYDNGSPAAWVLMCLNALKTFIFGISFGDQCQFFRKNSLSGGFPAIKLMEDVELSFRIREAGGFCFLYPGPVVSFRRWEKKGIFSNTANVLGLMMRFIFFRRLGLLPADTGEFYRQYYELI